MIVSNKTCIVVCSASNVTGASTPLSADLERIVLQIAHDEWKSTTRATLIREGGGRFSTWGCSAAAIVTSYYVMSTRYVEFECELIEWIGYERQEKELKSV
jgi:hypothetical protein